MLYVLTDKTVAEPVLSAAEGLVEGWFDRLTTSGGGRQPKPLALSAAKGLASTGPMSPRLGDSAAWPGEHKQTREGVVPPPAFGLARFPVPR